MGCEKISYGGLLQQISSVKARDGSNNLDTLSNGVEPFYISGWAAAVSSNQDGEFPSAVVHDNQFANHGFSSVLKNQTISCPSGEGFSDMMPSFVHSDDQNSGFHQILSKNQGPNACEVSKNGAFGGSPSAKGKRKNSEEGELRDSRPISQGRQARDGKLIGGKAKENDYVHVRAKRGQATNSHSLAERVRRERISERMKMLQDLVPGCNKITGKAVMLDEIINYVQSLQQQVEFLSMKLATVNSEMNIDLDLTRMLPNEIFHQRGNDATALGVHPESSFLQAFQGTTSVAMGGFSGANPPFHLAAPSLWNNELHDIRRTTGFDSNQSVNSLTPNGRP